MKEDRKCMCIDMHVYFTYKYTQVKLWINYVILIVKKVKRRVGRGEICAQLYSKLCSNNLIIKTVNHSPTVGNISFFSSDFF